MTVDTKCLFISSASCHHAECISCKITEIWKLQSVVLPPLHHKLSIALISCSCHFHMHCTKDLFSCAWHALRQV